MPNYYGYRTQRPKARNDNAAINEKLVGSQREQRCGKTTNLAQSSNNGDEDEVAQKKEKRAFTRLRNLKRKLGTKVDWLQYYKRVAKKKQSTPTGSKSGFMSTKGRAPRRLATGRAEDARRLATGRAIRETKSTTSEDEETDKELEAGEVLDLHYTSGTDTDENSDRGKLKNRIFEDTGIAIEL